MEEGVSFKVWKCASPVHEQMQHLPSDIPPGHMSARNLAKKIERFW